MDSFSGKNIKVFRVIYPEEDLETEKVECIIEEIEKTEDDFLNDINVSNKKKEKVEYEGVDVEEELEIHLDDELREVSKCLESDEEHSEIEDDFVSFIGKEREEKEEVNERDELVSRLTEMSITSASVPRSTCMRTVDFCLEEMLKKYN